ncbi:MAG: methyltransferase domain-containing protein [Thermoplasmatota archaeon]
MKLNLGCGREHLEGWINIDRVKDDAVDLIHDLNTRLPFDDNSVDEILASHVFEHILYWEDLLHECHRILKPSSIITIKVPYGFSPSIGHLRYFYPYTLDGFTDQWTNDNSLQVKPLFKSIKRRINRDFPFAWHMKKYFNINLPKHCFIGKYGEIVWVLKKLEVK